MYDLFLKLVRQELTSPTLIEIHPIKLNEYKAYMRNNLRELVNVNEKSIQYYIKMVENVFKDLDLLIRLRIIKAIIGSEITGESIDANFLYMINRAIDYLKLLFSGFIIEYENNVMVKFKKDCYVDGKMYRRGDLILLDNVTAFKLFLHECVDLVIEPYIKDKVLEDKS